jgi:hypothetical protein
MLNRWCGLSVLLMAACGGVNGAVDVDAGGPDAALPACDPLADFGTPARIPGLPAQSYFVWLTADERTVYFQDTPTAGGVGGGDLFVASRSTADGVLGLPTLLESVSSTADEEFAAVTEDQRTLVFGSNRPDDDETAWDIYVATRASTLVDFDEPDPVAGVNDATTADRGLWINADATALYFSTMREGRWQIMRTQRVGVGSFDMPIVVGELDSGEQENTPVLTADMRTIYFVSTRSGGKGLDDIWVARRSTTSDGFGPATPVTELNSAGYEWPLWASPDKCRLYYGNGDGVWVAQRGI